MTEVDVAEIDSLMAAHARTERSAMALALGLSPTSNERELATAIGRTVNPPNAQRLMVRA